MDDWEDEIFGAELDLNFDDLNVASQGNAPETYPAGQVLDDSSHLGAEHVLYVFRWIFAAFRKTSSHDTQRHFDMDLGFLPLTELADEFRELFFEFHNLLAQRGLPSDAFVVNEVSRLHALEQGIISRRDVLCSLGFDVFHLREKYEELEAVQEYERNDEFLREFAAVKVALRGLLKKEQEVQECLDSEIGVLPHLQGLEETAREVVKGAGDLQTKVWNLYDFCSMVAGTLSAVQLAYHSSTPLGVTECFNWKRMRVWVCGRSVDRVPPRFSSLLSTKSATRLFLALAKCYGWNLEETL